MRLSSMFFALLLASAAVPAQTSSMQYAPPRPTQACPVYMAAHRIGGLAAVQADTPAPNEIEKQMRARVLELKQQIDALKDQKANLQAKLGQNPDTATSADLQRQLNEIDAQFKEKEMEANQLTIKLTLEQARRSTPGSYTPTQGLDLNIAGANSQPIASVDILVHGFSNQAQMMPASQVPNAVPSVQNPYRPGNGLPIAPTESFHLTRDGSEASIRTSIVARGMMGISWIEVTRVEFADGSAWQPASGEMCHFAPSLYVPVAATAR